MFKKTWIRNLLVIAVLLGIFLGLAVNTVQPRGNLSFLEKGLRIAASPFQHGFRAVDGAVSGFFTYFTDKEKLQQENEELKRQLSQLNSELTQMSEINMENIRLRELLNYKEETRGQFQLQLAGIIAENNTNLQHTITLDRGSNDGIQTGMTVLNHSGLIGRITAVLPESSPSEQKLPKRRPLLPLLHLQWTPPTTPMITTSSTPSRLPRAIPVTSFTTICTLCLR